MSDPAGRLIIQLAREAGSLECRIQSSRPVLAASVLVGRTSGETSRLLPLLYSICAKAQAYACVEALESAAGSRPSEGVLWRRALSVEVETLREHLWRMLLDWPGLIGEPPARAALAGLLPSVKAIFALLDPDGCLFAPGSAEASLDEAAFAAQLDGLQRLIAEQILGCPAADWLGGATDAGSVFEWAERAATGPARLLRSVIEAGVAELGRSSASVLPEITDADIASRLQARDAASFIARPTWDGLPRETSTYARTRGSGLIGALSATFGNGLLARLAAQILEIASLACDLHLDRALERGPGQRRSLEPGIGIGRVEAARGHLVHLARLEQDRIADYRILAPTEWNFHPQGPLAAALRALPEADDARLRRSAELLIMALDPCVGYELRLATVDSSTSFVS